MLNKTINKLIWLLSLITMLHAQSQLKLTFSQTIKDKDTGRIVVHLENESNETVKVLKWKTPFENKLTANIFHITNGRNTARYIGKSVKRLKPKESDYLVLKPHESIDKMIHLSLYYRIEGKGPFYVSYRGDLKVKTKRNHVLDLLSTLSIPTIKISSLPVIKQKKTAYHTCSNGQRNILNEAHIAAIEMAEDASNAMNSASQNTTADRYRVWFGAADSSRQSRVTTHFNNIYTALNQRNITFDCTSCTESDVLAYV